MIKWEKTLEDGNNSYLLQMANHQFPLRSIYKTTNRQPNYNYYKIYSIIVICKGKGHIGTETDYDDNIELYYRTEPCSNKVSPKM